MKIEIFGEIDPNKLNDFYEDTLSIEGKEVDIDLNFEESSIDSEVLISISNYIKNIDTNLKKAMGFVAADFELDEDSETAREYLEHHEDEIPTLFGDQAVTKEMFLSKLRAYRVGFYPEESDSFVIIDIQFPRDLTNYLMAVTLDNEYKLACIDMES